MSSEKPPKMQFLNLQYPNSLKGMEIKTKQRPEKSAV